MLNATLAQLLHYALGRPLSTAPEGRSRRADSNASDAAVGAALAAASAGTTSAAPERTVLRAMAEGARPWALECLAPPPLMHQSPLQVQSNSNMCVRVFVRVTAMVEVARAPR